MRETPPTVTVTISLAEVIANTGYTGSTEGVGSNIGGVNRPNCAQSDLGVAGAFDDGLSLFRGVSRLIRLGNRQGEIFIWPGNSHPRHSLSMLDSHKWVEKKDSKGFLHSLKE